MCKNVSVVYIEEVVFDNFVINTVLLCITLFILREKRVWRRVSFCAAVGTVFAVFLPFIDRLVILYKFGALFAVTGFAAKFKSIKSYILFVLVFSAVSFAAGGAAYGLCYLLTGSGDFRAYAYTGAYARAVKGAVTGGIALLWVVTRQIGKFWLRRRISASDGLTAELLIEGKCETVPCFDDTGNKLVDGRTLKPVMVLSHDVGAHYVREGARTLEVATVNAVSDLPLITADKFTLHTASGDKVFEKMPIAVSDRTFTGYKLIFNSEVL